MALAFVRISFQEKGERPRKPRVQWTAQQQDLAPEPTSSRVFPQTLKGTGAEASQVRKKRPPSTALSEIGFDRSQSHLFLPVTLPLRGAPRRPPLDSISESNAKDVSSTSQCKTEPSPPRRGQVRSSEEAREERETGAFREQTEAEGEATAAAVLAKSAKNELEGGVEEDCSRE